MMLLVSGNAFKALAQKSLPAWAVVESVEGGKPVPSGFKVVTMNEFAQSADTLESRYASRSAFTHVLMVA